MRLIDCDETQSEAIRGILNESIAHSTAIYDYRPRSRETMAAWFELKRRGGFPIVGAISREGEFMGFGSYGSFRALPAYKYTVEHSVYVGVPFRGQGVGKRLLKELIARARHADLHVMVGGIDSSNTASINLHEQFGFRHVATMPQVGFKFGRWLDLLFYQLILDTPAQPSDG